MAARRTLRLRALLSGLLEMIEKGAEEWRIQILQGQTRRRLAQAFLCILYQQPKRIAIARDGVGAGLALSHQPVHEERFD